MASPTVHPAVLEARGRALPVRLLAGGLPRFLMGGCGAIAAGWLGFRSLLFSVDQPTFQCITVGLLAAGMLALVRVARPGLALALVPAFAAIRAAVGWREALAALLLGLGVFLVALIFDELARYGLRLGKFLLAGPLLGGVYLALAPITEFETLGMFSTFRPLMFQLYLGIVIGNGVGLGVELAELLLDAGAHDDGPWSPAGGAPAASPDPRSRG